MAWQVLNQGADQPLKANQFPDPRWNEFFFEEPGDGEGQVQQLTCPSGPNDCVRQILVSVQLIPSKPGHASQPPEPDIKPGLTCSLHRVTCQM